MRNLFVLLSFSLSALAYAPAGRAALNLDEPAVLLAKAGQGKNELRDVINQIDQNLAEMRDVRTFDKYFFLLDDLQTLADRFNLNSIYPDAVKKLGGRMVQKGVNWLDIIHDSREKILYYHRWMIEPQPAFAFLYSVDLQLKAPNTDPELLKIGAENLEAALVYADQRWPNENSLRLLYRSTLSDIAIRILKDPNLPEAEVLFWLTKIYSPNAMTEIVVDIQNKVFSLTADQKADLHLYLKRLSTIYAHVTTGRFAAPDSLLSQIGDTIVDLIIRSFRFQERLSDEEYERALAMMQKRHFASLANAWTTLNQAPGEDFANYYIQRAFRFILALQNIGMNTEAELLSRIITQKASSILARHYDLEGLWEITDSKGRRWFLNIIYPNENYIFVNLVQIGGLSLPMYYVAYDMKVGGFIATRRGIDPDLAPNIPLRFFPREDGTLDLIYLFKPDADPVMKARKVQKYPDVFKQKRDPAPDLNGVYEGELTIEPGNTQPIRFSVTVINSETIANLQHPSFMGTFNYGSDGRGGVLYITRGNDMLLGYWMHLRATLTDDGYLTGYMIMGNRGLLPTPIRWKKVRSIL